MPTKRKPMMTPAKAVSRIERSRKRMVDFAVEFCSIGTVNPPGDRYVECCEFLARRMRAMGLTAKIHRPPKALQAKVLPGFDDYPRTSVVGRWDVGAAKTLHFTGHLDVVPPTSGWRTDPFKPIVTPRRIVARGSNDMKTSITAALFAAAGLKDSGVTPPWNIEVSATPDEETGGELGLGWLVKSRTIRPDAAVLCEGGGEKGIGYAHKGVLWLEVTVLGKPGHACNPPGGVNALEKACGLIAQLKTLEKAYAKRPSAFKVDKPVLRRPTIMIGGISGGGGKVNTIPDRFSFTIDRRLLPEEGLAAAKAEIMAVIRRAQRRDRSLKVKVRQLLHVPPGSIAEDHPHCRRAADAYRAVFGRRPKWRMTPGFTDMHWLTGDAGVPTFMYGVSGIGAHADLEYSEIDSMVETAKLYAELAMRMPA